MKILDYDEVNPLQVLHVTMLALDFPLTPEHAVHFRQQDSPEDQFLSYQEIEHDQHRQEPQQPPLSQRRFRQILNHRKRRRRQKWKGLHPGSIQRVKDLISYLDNYDQWDRPEEQPVRWYTCLWIGGRM